MKRQDRTPEIYYYEWSVNRWRSSETRTSLSLAGRGLYRELLDLCYTQGSIPRDFQILAAQVGCAPIEIEREWPRIERHFYADKHRPDRLRNRAADLYRKTFFEYIESQKTKGRKGGLGKSNRINAMHSSGLGVAASLDIAIADTSLAIAVADKQKPQQQQFGCWPETAKAIQEKYPDVDAMFVEKLAIKCAAAHTSVDRPNCVFSDRLMADAIRQYKNSKQDSAGLYLTAIPNVISSWARNGHEPEEDGEVHY